MASTCLLLITQTSSVFAEEGVTASRGDNWTGAYVGLNYIQRGLTAGGASFDGNGFGIHGGYTQTTELT